MTDHHQELVHELFRALGKRTISVAESLTGGLVCARITQVPGASAFLRGGLVTYATDLKHSLTKVPTDLLASQGPVSPATALAMAAGVAGACSSDFGLALTGVAGPDAQDGHPVGTVFIAMAQRGSGDEIVRQEFRELAITPSGQTDLERRESIRNDTLGIALQFATEFINLGL